MLQVNTKLLIDMNRLPDNWQAIIGDYITAIVEGMPVYLEPDYLGYIHLQEVLVEQV